jgi:O-acetylhomoserine (thiol)-lyase
VTFAQFGIDVTFVDSDDPANFRPALRRIPRPSMSKRSAIHNSTSPIFRHRRDRPQRRRPARRRQHARLAYLCRPFEHGADIVIHSVTKYLGGHGTTMGGILVESGKFDWATATFRK